MFLGPGSKNGKKKSQKRQKTGKRNQFFPKKLSSPLGVRSTWSMSKKAARCHAEVQPKHLCEHGAARHAQSGSVSGAVGARAQRIALPFYGVVPHKVTSE